MVAGIGRMAHAAPRVLGRLAAAGVRAGVLAGAELDRARPARGRRQDGRALRPDRRRRGQPDPARPERALPAAACLALAAARCAQPARGRSRRRAGDSAGRRRCRRSLPGGGNLGRPDPGRALLQRRARTGLLGASGGGRRRGCRARARRGLQCQPWRAARARQRLRRGRASEPGHGGRAAGAQRQPLGQGHPAAGRADVGGARARCGSFRAAGAGHDAGGAAAQRGRRLPAAPAVAPGRHHGGLPGRGAGRAVRHARRRPPPAGRAGLGFAGAGARRRPADRRRAAVDAAPVLCGAARDRRAAGIHLRPELAARDRRRLAGLPARAAAGLGASRVPRARCSSPASACRSRQCRRQSTCCCPPVCCWRPASARPRCPGAPACVRCWRSCAPELGRLRASGHGPLLDTVQQLDQLRHPGRRKQAQRPLGVDVRER